MNFFLYNGALWEIRYDETIHSLYKYNSNSKADIHVSCVNFDLEWLMRNSAIDGKRSGDIGIYDAKNGAELLRLLADMAEKGERIK